MKGSNRFQNGSLTLVKNKKADDSWFFRYYEDVDGSAFIAISESERCGNFRVVAMLRKPSCLFAQRSIVRSVRQRR